ncbi:hypothetical protein V493_03757 [Pseudogymnoascus sp. VKM F-4281 (FW-2241)]|nr:hypothetical protein V493_03757 [Pseudogymnoascus sp. VKM F-4281 (FW-2241)]
MKGKLSQVRNLSNRAIYNTYVGCRLHPSAAPNLVGIRRWSGEGSLLKEGDYTRCGLLEGPGTGSCTRRPVPGAAAVAESKEQYGFKLADSGGSSGAGQPPYPPPHEVYDWDILIFIMIQPQRYANITVYCPVAAPFSAKARAMALGVPGTLTHTKQPPRLLRHPESHAHVLGPSPGQLMAAASALLGPLTRCWDGMCRRALGSHRGCGAGRGRECTPLHSYQQSQKYSRQAGVGADSFGMKWMPLRAPRPVLEVAAFVWVEQVFFMLLAL